MWSVEAGTGASLRFYPSSSLQRHLNCHLHLGTEDGKGGIVVLAHLLHGFGFEQPGGTLAGGTVQRPLQPPRTLEDGEGGSRGRLILLPLTSALLLCPVRPGTAGGLAVPQAVP